MTANIRGIARWVAMAGLAITLGPQSWAHAQVGRKIPVGNYPSMKKGSPGLVLIEVSDFQVLEIVHGVQPYEEIEQKLNGLLAPKSPKQGA